MTSPTTADPASAAPTASLLFGAEDATGISHDPATIKDWSQAETLIRTEPLAWISTVRKDGRPHTQRIMIAWGDGTPVFASRPGSLKSRNLARAGHSTITLSNAELDLVLEGRAERAVTAADFDTVAAALREQLGWEFALEDGRAYQADLPGRPEYAFYRLHLDRAYGYGPDGATATRWVF